MNEIADHRAHRAERRGEDRHAARNIEEGRTQPVLIVCRKPG